MTDAFDPATLAFYAAQARPYLSHRPDQVSPELPPFLDHLPRGAAILELGCGGGHDAHFMTERGFAVDATDGVAAMAAEAEARLGREVRVMRFDELAAVAHYDAVVAIASLLHVPHAELAAIHARIWRSLKPGGWHLATYKTGQIAGYDSHGRYYNYLSRADAESFYRAGGNWSSISFEEHDGVGYFSAPCRWLHVIAQKAETA
jgi:SAM-dependent methyltransferase